jgi:hypothetical protein
LGQEFDDFPLTRGQPECAGCRFCPWHTEIQDCDVGSELLGFFYCLPAVTRLRYHCPVGIICENGPNTYPKDFVTTCYEQANAWHFIFLSAAGRKRRIRTGKTRARCAEVGLGRVPVQQSYSQITALSVQYGANRSATLLTPYPTGVWRLLVSVTPSKITERRSDRPGPGPDPIQSAVKKRLSSEGLGCVPYCTD